MTNAQRPTAASRCKAHTDRAAAWKCESCRNTLCDDCILVRRVGSKQIQVCMQCKGRCVALSPEARGIPPKPFSTRLMGAFSYPFQGSGIVVLLGGGIFFWLLSYVPILGWFVTLGFISAYMLRVINHSGDGKDELPDWDGFYNYWDSVIRPTFLVVGTFAFCFAPVILHTSFSISMDITGNDLMIDPLWWILLLGGLFYYPMGLLAVAMFNSGAALNPLLVLRSIFRVFPHYMVACGILAIVLVASSIADRIGNPLVAIPIVGPVLVISLSLYFLTVEMRILGLIYHANRVKLEWF